MKPDTVTVIDESEKKNKLRTPLSPFEKDFGIRIQDLEPNETVRIKPEQALHQYCMDNNIFGNNGVNMGLWIECYLPDGAMFRMKNTRSEEEILSLIKEIPPGTTFVLTHNLLSSRHVKVAETNGVNPILFYRKDELWLIPLHLKEGFSINAHRYDNV